MDIYMKPNHITHILKTLQCLSSCLKMKSKFLNSGDKFPHDFPFFLYFLVSCLISMPYTSPEKNNLVSHLQIYFHDILMPGVPDPSRYTWHIYAFLVFETWFEFCSSVKTHLMISPFSLST